MSDKPTASKPRSRFPTVSSRLAALCAIGFSVGFVIVIWIQTEHARTLLYEAELRSDISETELIASELYGAVRWRKPAIIRKTYDTMIAHEDLDVVAAVALDREGELLASYPPASGGSLPLQEGGLEDLIASHAARTQTTVLDDNFAVVTPIYSDERLDRAGTLAIVWSLERVDRTTRAMMIQFAIVTLVLLAALVSLTLFIVHRQLSRPLARVTEATTRIANGEKSFDIPCTDRRDEVGDMARALVTFRMNVSLIDRLTAEQQQQAQRLANALEKEREYNALHREFVSMVSHEFRTPVAIIDGAAQRIERRAGKDSPDQLRDRTGKIRNAVARMIELIDSTLSVTRLEAGSIELEPSPCDFAALLHDVCQRQQDLAKQHKISLTIADMPPQILIDTKRMDQVFTNLLSNAVKYAPDAPDIKVKAGTIGNQVVVSVRDYGLGIPEGEQSKLFEKFFRASTSTGIPGTGIGLHLVKHLVELHDGSVTIDSREGSGTTVSVSFPVKLAEDATAAEKDHPTAAALA